MTDIRIAHSVCAHDCPSTCALDVERLPDGRIGRVRGAAGHPYVDGVVCNKVARYAERVHHPDRLTVPLRRIGPKGSGQFAPLAWDDALDLVAERMASAARRLGPEAVWPYHSAGTMGLVQRFGIKRLRHVMRYSSLLETFCTAIASAGWQAGVGARRGTDAREMADSDLIVVWGGNPVHTQVQVMSWIQRARRNRGAKLVVVDPYSTPTADKADLYLALRPGTDGALACAMMHVLFAEGFADRDYLARYTDLPVGLESHLADRGPDWAAAITGLPAEQIIAFARLYGSTKRSYIRVGFGFTRQRNGAAAMHAVTCLPAVTGAWAHKGGGALWGQSSIYGLDVSLLDGSDVRDPSVRTLHQTRVGAALTGEARDLAGGPPVTAMLIQNSNPLATAPDSTKVRQGFAREDLFVCVHEQFMTETARMADVVLPATSFFEHDDIYQASGHTFLQAARAVLAPIGQSRPNHFVISQLAQRLGAKHPAFEMTEWQLIDAVLKASGKPGADELLAGRWLDCAPDFRAAHFLDGFPQPDGRFRFAPDWAAAGPHHRDMPPLPDHLAVIDDANEARPFRLVAAPSRHFLNTSFSETPGSRQAQGRPTVLVHPNVCRRMSLEDGDLVELGNRQGTVRLHLRQTPGVGERTVVVEGVWPSAAFVDGVGINVLTSAEPIAPAGGAAYHDTAVWLRAAGP
jgi:anaerobic selenocysteine-containing dehydrogenase